MIRFIFISSILLGSLVNGFAQNDTFLKKSSDTQAIAASQADTTVRKSHNLINAAAPKPATGSDEVYKLNLAVDIPLTAVTAGWSLYAFPKIYDKKGITQQELNNLNTNNINGFDRWAADVYHENAAKNSDLFFYAAMPLPFVLLIDREIRKDALKVGFLYLEAMSVTGLFYTGSAYLWDRYRPLTYIKNPNAELLSDQLSGNARNSFLAGHPALVATSSFFVASVYADYHPDSKFKYVLYGAAAVVTGGTAYLRHRGGKHFPSDLIVGTTIGTLSGILVPRFHKNKAYRNSKVRVMPFTGESHGLHMVYKL
ncbi:MAG: phosphatase PAP2 family protein [Chitinophagaceae bacterium]|nr:phosphatase PAP2 family protein [Chitinophagaceae bacterium]